MEILLFYFAVFILVSLTVFHLIKLGRIAYRKGEISRLKCKRLMLFSIAGGLIFYVICFMGVQLFFSMNG